MTTGREFLEEIGAAVSIARQLRYAPPETFDDLSVDELDVVERNLRAISYSCTTGALALARIRRAREAAT